jgi:hypothetical protein
MQRAFVGNTFQLLAKLAHKVCEVDEADAQTAPQMVVNLSDGRDAQAGILQGILHVFGLSAACLDAQ